MRDYLVKGMQDEEVKNYYNAMVDNAILFGANRKQAKKEMKEALEFEMKLADVSLVFYYFNFSINYFPWVKTSEN